MPGKTLYPTLIPQSPNPTPSNGCILKSDLICTTAVSADQAPNKLHGSAAIQSQMPRRWLRLGISKSELRLSPDIARNPLRHVVSKSTIGVPSTKCRDELLSSSLMLSCSRLMPASFTHLQIRLCAPEIAVQCCIRLLRYQGNLAFQKVVEGLFVQVAWQCSVVSLHSETLRSNAKITETGYCGGGDYWVKRPRCSAQLFVTRSSPHDGKAAAMLNPAKSVKQLTEACSLHVVEGE